MDTNPECRCGCGRHTKGGRYLPGHDAKHVSWVFALIETNTLAVSEGLAQFDVSKGGTSAALYNKLARRLRNAGYRYNSADREWTKP